MEELLYIMGCIGPIITNFTLILRALRRVFLSI